MLWLAYIAFGMLLLAVCGRYLLHAYMGRFNGNIRVVEPRLVYRSGQLSGDRLAGFLTGRNIRAVLNLRGDVPDDVRIEEERQACAARGIVYVDLALYDKSLPSPDSIEALLEELDTLPRPLLIHCAAGSDRTGLACTLYAHLHQGLSLDHAQSRHLTWRYGHTPWGSSRAMDHFFNLYRQTGLGRPVRDWITDRYPGVYAAHSAEQEAAVCPTED